MVLDFGPAGAALATIISQAASFLCCVVYLVKLGTPMAIKSAFIQISKLFVNSWINSYGIAVSAFAGIANKIASISNLVSNAMNTAGSTMVGQNIAAKEYKRVKSILKSLAVITISVATVISIVIWLYPNAIFGMFTDEAKVLEIGVKYVPIAVLLFYGSAMRAWAMHWQDLLHSGLVWCFICPEAGRKKK